MTKSAGLDKFETVMNMPGSFSKSSYNEKRLYSAFAESAKESIQNAAQEVPNIANPNAEMSDVVDIYICIDGSWRKKRAELIKWSYEKYISRKQNGVRCASTFQVLPFIF